LGEYQFGRLRSLVEFAHAHVPYYRAILDDHGLTPQRLQSPHDLRDFPFLTREIVRTRFDDLRARANLPRVHQRSSGGSTGVPVTVLVDMRRMGFVEAARMRARSFFSPQTSSANHFLRPPACAPSSPRRSRSSTSSARPSRRPWAARSASSTDAGTGAWSPSNAPRADYTSPPRACTWRSSTRTPRGAVRSC